MTGVRLHGGPADKTALVLNRTPKFIRVVKDMNTGKVDALDLLDDTPKEREVIFLYARDTRLKKARVYAEVKGIRTAVDQIGYRHRPVADPEILESFRSNKAWRKWVKMQNVVEEKKK